MSDLIDAIDAKRAPFHCTTAQLRAAVHVRVPAPEYATLDEVRDAAGFGANRSIDMLSMSLWPSRGLTLTGIELKTSRSDWRRELRNPAKAESIASRCHFFVIAAPQYTVPVSEIPEGWGLWEWTRGGKWLTTVVPPRREPEPLTHSFLAAILRRSDEAITARIEEGIRAARGGEEAKFQERVQQEAARRTHRSAEAIDKIKKFEESSGLSLEHAWEIGDIGAAVRMVLAAKGNSHLLDSMQRLHADLGSAIDAYKETSCTS